MKRDNGNHAAAPGAVTAHEKAIAELACRELTDERDRLKTLNAALLDVLQAIVTCEDEGDTELYDLDMGERPGPSPWQSSQLRNAMSNARAALAKARP